MKKSERRRMIKEAQEAQNSMKGKNSENFDFSKKISIEISEKQKLVLNELLNNKDDCNRYLLIGGGANGGKTFGICVGILTTCLYYPGIKWCAGRSSVQQTDRSLRLTLNKVLNSLGFKMGTKLDGGQAVKGGHYYYDASKKYYHFANGSEIWLLAFGKIPSDPEYEFLSGQEYTYCYIDEVQDGVEKKVVDIITTRLRHETDKYGIIPKVFMSCNPKKCWIKEEFYDPFKQKNEKKGNKFIQMLYTDNIKIDQQKYRDQILSTNNKIAIERKLKGNWEYDDTPGKIYNYDDLCDMFTNKPIKLIKGIGSIDSNLGDKYLMTIDPSGGGEDKAVCFVWKGWEIVDSLIHFGSVDLNLFKEEILNLKQKYNIRNKMIFIDSNGVGYGLTSELNASEKHLIDGMHQVNEYYAQGKEIKTTKTKQSNQLIYRNLRDQCFFMLKDYIHKIRIRDQKLYEFKNDIINELDVMVQVDIDGDDNKIKVLSKSGVKAQIDASSPDLGDNFSFRVFAELKTFNKQIKATADEINESYKRKIFRGYRSI